MSTWTSHKRPKQLNCNDDSLMHIDEPFAPEFEVLQLLKLKIVLKSKLKKVGEGSQEKEELTEKIDEINSQFQLKGVEYENGWPVLR